MINDNDALSPDRAYRRYALNGHLTSLGVFSIGIVSIVLAVTTDQSSGTGYSRLSNELFHYANGSTALTCIVAALGIQSAILVATAALEDRTVFDPRKESMRTLLLLTTSAGQLMVGYYTPFFILQAGKHWYISAFVLGLIILYGGFSFSFTSSLWYMSKNIEIVEKSISRLTTAKNEIVYELNGMNSRLFVWLDRRYVQTSSHVLYSLMFSLLFILIINGESALDKVIATVCISPIILCEWLLTRMVMRHSILHSPQTAQTSMWNMLVKYGLIGCFSAYTVYVIYDELGFTSMLLGLVHLIFSQSLCWFLYRKSTGARGPHFWFQYRIRCIDHALAAAETFLRVLEDRMRLHSQPATIYELSRPHRESDSRTADGHSDSPR